MFDYIHLIYSGLWNIMGSKITNTYPRRMVIDLFDFTDYFFIYSFLVESGETFLDASYRCVECETGDRNLGDIYTWIQGIVYKRPTCLYMFMCNVGLDLLS